MAPRITPAALAALVALLGGCATRLIADQGGDVDGALVEQSVDLAQTPTHDLAPPPQDLAQSGKDCGQIVMCMIGCGFVPGVCQLNCFAGGSPQGIQEAGALLACAVQNCVSFTDGGGGNPLQCVFFQCGSQVSMCQGLGFGA